MSADRWLFVSDVHLHPNDQEKQDLLATFLLGHPDLDHLCIVGDLFDFWFGLRRRRFSGFGTVLGALRQLSDRGVAVHYVEGNHDFCLGPYFTHHYGASVYPNGTEFEIGGMRVWVEHGDMANPKEFRYRLFRALTRSRPAGWVGEALGPRRLQAFGRWFDQASYGMGYSPEHHQAHPAFRQHAARRIAEGYDVVVMGHAHVPGDEEVEVDERRGRYLNVGDWIYHRSYVTFDPECGFRLHNPPPDGGSAPAEEPHP